jgi:3-deoxy-manno-octulosonate cytidylyltransferase (CMP-KDO synthetase)
MRVLGVIPARYASSRFPGKPLAMIGSESMISRVYHQSLKCKQISRLAVATDDQRIYDHVKGFGGSVFMTSSDHPSGTDRIGEVIEQIRKTSPDEQYDLVINIQGDEPFLDPSQLELLIHCFAEPGIDIGTLRKVITEATELSDPNVVKVVTDNQQNALYFSRSTIPFYRQFEKETWLLEGKHFKHIGLYIYRTDVLEQIIRLEPGQLEKAESLEQLRWLENGFRIKVLETNLDTIAIDTPEDLLKFTNKQ